MNNGLNAYRQNSVANAEYSDPHRLVQMLFDGAQERLARAIGHAERGEIAAKSECLGRAILIIDNLQASLNHDAGDGELAGRLQALYDYMLRRLTEANLKNDPGLIREVRSLIGDLSDGWQAIPEAVRAEAAAGRGNEP